MKSSIQFLITTMVVKWELFLLHAGATSANFNNCLFVNNDGWSKRWAGAGALNLRTTSSVNNCTFYNNSFADSSAKGDLECTSTVYGYQFDFLASDQEFEFSGR